MSLQARAINNENAGVPRAQNFKPGEAPTKQTGPIKRKGLSEMGGNQQLGPRGLGGAPKAAQTKPSSKVVKRKKGLCDEPIELMFPSTEAGLSFRDPLAESGLACDLTKDSSWSMGEAGCEEDYFARENRRFGLSVEEMPFIEDSAFAETVVDLPDLDLDLYDC